MIEFLKDVLVGAGVLLGFITIIGLFSLLLMYCGVTIAHVAYTGCAIIFLFICLIIGEEVRKN